MSVTFAASLRLGRVAVAVGLLVVGAAPLAGQARAPDSVVRRPLERDSVIDGVPCAAHAKIPAEFHRDGRLAGCFVSRVVAVGSATLPEGTWLDRDPRGVVTGAWPAKETVIAGLPCRGEGFKAWHVRFHPSGALQSCFLAREHRVAGIPCMAGTFLREVRSGGTAVVLRVDGSLAQCVVARDGVVDGVTLRKWSRAARDTTGAVRVLP